MHVEKEMLSFSFRLSKSVPITLLEVLLFIHRRLISPRGKKNYPPIKNCQPIESKIFLKSL